MNKIHPGAPCRDPQTIEALTAELSELVTRAQTTGVEVAGWLAEGLAVGTANVPRGIEGLLAQRPGSWEADLVRGLVCGTVGWQGENLDLYRAHPKRSAAGQRRLSAHEIACAAAHLERAVQILRQAGAGEQDLGLLAENAVVLAGLGDRIRDAS